MASRWTVAVAGMFIALAPLARAADLTVAQVRAALVADHPANFAHRSLAGLDLSGFDLSGADLHGADLSGADTHGADFSGANLSGVRGLSGAR